MTSFIRLAGCSLRCRWCDSPYSFHRGQNFSLSSIMDAVTRFGWKYVCVTGGEPLLQPAAISLLEALVRNHYSVSLETNGALSTADVPHDVRIILDVKCPQSGMHEHTDWSNLTRLRPDDEVKFVIADRSDFEWACSVIADHGLFDRGDRNLFSPVFGELDPKTLVEWMIKEKIPARLNLQIHKYIWDPSVRGV